MLVLLRIDEGLDAAIVGSARIDLDRFHIDITIDLGCFRKNNWARAMDLADQVSGDDDFLGFNRADEGQFATPAENEFFSLKSLDSEFSPGVELDGVSGDDRAGDFTVDDQVSAMDRDTLSAGFALNLDLAESFNFTIVEPGDAHVFEIDV